MLTIKEHIAYWIDSADEDILSAQSNFDHGTYVWCLFIGHLALEKALKALFVITNENKTPPKIHNLLRLAKLSELDLTNEQSEFFSLVNKFQLETRYPEYKSMMSKIATLEFTKTNFIQIKEHYQWLKSLIK